MKTDNKIQYDAQSLQTVVSVSVANLRIGNFIHYNGNHREVGTISSIITDLSNNIKIGLNNRIDIFYSINEIMPIPLMQEWFYKFKFSSNFTSDPQEQQASKVFKKGDFKIHMPNEDIQEFIIEVNEFKEIKYVHELQNVYYFFENCSLTNTCLTEH